MMDGLRGRATYRAGSFPFEVFTARRFPLHGFETWLFEPPASPIACVISSVCCVQR